MVRLAISAANADGVMNERERAAILQQAHGAGVGDIVEREHCMGLTIVGDAMGRPLADALVGSTRTRDFSGFYRIGSGGGVFSPAVPESLKAGIPHGPVMDGEDHSVPGSDRPPRRGTACGGAARSASRSSSELLRWTPHR